MVISPFIFLHSDLTIVFTWAYCQYLIIFYCWCQIYVLTVILINYVTFMWDYNQYRFILTVVIINYIILCRIIAMINFIFVRVIIDHNISMLSYRIWFFCCTRYKLLYLCLLNRCNFILIAVIVNHFILFSNLPNVILFLYSCSFALILKPNSTFAHFRCQHGFPLSLKINPKHVFWIGEQSWDIQTHRPIATPWLLSL